MNVARVLQLDRCPLDSQVLHYAATAADAASVGFDDAFIYEEMRVAEADRKIPFRQITPGPARLAPFEAWTANVARTHY